MDSRLEYKIGLIYFLVFCVFIEKQNISLFKTNGAAKK